MIYFIGAGPGAPDLITVRGAGLLKKAGMIVYAGSLVSHELVRTYAGENCEILNSSSMTLDEIIASLISGHERGLVTVRLHSGDPSLYGAIREQIDHLKAKHIPFEIVPGVSSLFAAASSIGTEFTIPGHAQTLIISRLGGKTRVPEREGLRNLAGHGASMAVFLSAGDTGRVCDELIAGGYAPDTPAAMVYHASWPDERVISGTLRTLPGLSEGITKTALILAGGFLSDEVHEASRLYDASFSHEYRP